ncbi:hypothetical protein [Serratia proteamaculans]|uniref:hypothetical protein n=1 Tax=Serratia proteamaculans TaxID=28151 RepID=UPI003D06E230
MKTKATKIPKANSLRSIDLDQLERVPAYIRARVCIVDDGQAITASRRVRS